MKRVKIMAVALLVPLCMSAVIFQKSKYIWHKNEENYVKLGKANKDLGKLNHPADISPEAMTKILLSIRYDRNWMNIPGDLGKKAAKQYDVFTADEAAQLGGYLSKALKEADSSSWVDFSLEGMRNKLAIFGTQRVTDGLVFVKDHKLNFAFRDLGEVSGSETFTAATTDPFKYYPGSSGLSAQPGQELAKNPKGKLLKNWIIIDLPRAPETSAPQAETSTQPQIQTATTVEGKPVEKPKPPAEEKSPKQRLIDLRELYDKGLITEEEYNKKRKEILDQL